MMKVKKPAAAANGAESSIAKPLIAKPIVAKASAGLKAMIEAKRRAKAEAEAAAASNVPSTSAQATVKITGAESSGKFLAFFCFDLLVKQICLITVRFASITKILS